MDVGMDLVDSCLLVLSSDEENFPFSTNSLDELDIVYTRRVLQCIQGCQLLKPSKTGIYKRDNGISPLSRR